MVLQLYDRRTNARVGEPLTITESDIIKDYFANNVTLFEGHVAWADNFLDKLLVSPYHLACDCDLSAETPPLLNGVRPSTLKRMPKGRNTAHSEKCCFTDRANGKSADVIPVRTPPKPDDNMMVFRPFSTGRNNKGATQTRTPTEAAGTRFAPLSRVLYKLVSESKTNWLFHNDTRTNLEHADAMIAAANKIRLAGDEESNVYLGEALVVAKDEPSSVRELSNLKKHLPSWQEWPEDSRPQGFLVGGVQGYNYNDKKFRFELNCLGWENAQFVEARPAIFAEATPSSKRTPYISIVAYACPSMGEAEKALGLRCFMQPCWKPESWFPVDSHAERETLEMIIQLRKRLPSGIEMHIEKPLFDTKVSTLRGDVSCRPDFVLWLVQGQVVNRIAIETMGMTDGDYGDRKSRTHPAMIKQWTRLIQHDVKASSKTERAIADQLFEQQLIRCIAKGTQPTYPSIAAVP